MLQAHQSVIAAPTAMPASRRTIPGLRGPLSTGALGFGALTIRRYRAKKTSQIVQVHAT